MPEEIQAGQFRLLTIPRLLTLPSGDTAKLTQTETRLLAFLMPNPGQILERDAIIEHVWSYASDSAVKSAIYRLRRKIELDPAHPRYLQQMGEGYGFFPEITTITKLPLDCNPPITYLQPPKTIMNTGYGGRKMALTNAIQRWSHIRPKTRAAILLACLGLATVLGAVVVLSSPPEQHCVVSGAFTVVNETTGQIIDPAGPVVQKCFSSFAEAIDFGSGGALNLPPDASREEVFRALEERPLH